MNRASINPWDWGLQFGMDQAQLVTGLNELLHCSGQTALVPDPEAHNGIRVEHEGDMRGQIELSLAHVDAILAHAGMDRTNLLSMRIFVTDIDAFSEHFDVYVDWLRPAGIRLPMSLIGVSQLARPGLLIEIEPTAGR